MHNLQEIKCTFFNFFLRLDQGTGCCGTGEQLYWLQRRAWQMSGCQAPLSPGRRVQDDPDLQPSQARSRTIVLVTPRACCSCPGLGSPVRNNCTGYTPSKLRIPWAEQPSPEQLYWSREARSPGTPITRTIWYKRQYYRPRQPEQFL